jgi:2-methylcitrate dehydratase PrpD
VAVVRRDVTLNDFTEDSINDRRVLSIASKVRAVIEPELTAMPMAQAPCLVEIRMKGGSVGPQRVDYAKGSPQDPMSVDESIDKLKKCLRFSVKSLPERNVEEVIEMVSHLEDVKEVSRIATLLS